MLRESNTIVVERNWIWSGAFETEPNEAAWAHEAIYFVRALSVSGDASGAKARVQISPDGMYWCDEGGELHLPEKPGETTFVRIRHFGGWLRLAGELPAGTELRVVAHLNLKA
jgi:hypothetical protein